MRIKKERVLFDNYDTSDFEEWKKDYLENFGDDERFVSSENGEIYENALEDADLWGFYMDNKQIEWEETLVSLKDFDDTNKVILFGSVGLWNGVFRGGRIFNSIEDAIYYALEDCGYWKIYDENGLLNIVCSHHDGTCHFCLKQITDKGCDYLENWEYNFNDTRSEEEVHEQIIKRYSKNLHFAHRQWGCKKQEYVKPTKEVLIGKLNNEARSFYC